MRSGKHFKNPSDNETVGFFFCMCADLQWTTMGPASGGLHVFTRRRKARMGVGYSGTP